MFNFMRCIFVTKSKSFDNENKIKRLPKNKFVVLTREILFLLLEHFSCARTGPTQK